MTGVVFSDVAGNGEYEPGGGLGGVTITVADVGSTTTLDAGGFSMQLAPGTYTVELGGSPVTDLSGNPAPQGPAGTFQASTQPTLEVSPAVGVDTHTNATISNSASLTLGGYGEADSTLKVYNGTLLVGTTQTGADGSWSITYEAPQNGTYDFSAVATESMGNTGAPSVDSLVEVDTVPPTSSVTLTFSRKETFPTGGRITVISSLSGGITGASGVALAGTTAFTISAGGHEIGAP